MGAYIEPKLSDYVCISKEQYEQIEKILILRNYPMHLITPIYFNEDVEAVKRGKKTKRFDADQVKEIQKKLAEGMSIKNASFQFQCSTRTIQQIKNNKY